MLPQGPPVGALGRFASAAPAPAAYLGQRLKLEVGGGSPKVGGGALRPYPPRGHATEKILAQPSFDLLGIGWMQLEITWGQASRQQTPSDLRRRTRGHAPPRDLYRGPSLSAL